MDGRNPLKMPMGFDPAEWPLHSFGYQPWHSQTVHWTWFMKGTEGKKKSLEERRKNSLIEKRDEQAKC